MYKVTKCDDPSFKNSVFIQGYCDFCGGKTNGFWTSDHNFSLSSYKEEESNHKDPFICVKNLREQIKIIAKTSSDTYFLSEENIN